MMWNEIQRKMNDLTYAAQNRFNQNMNNFRGQLYTMRTNPLAQKVVKKVVNKLK